jgi:hypothetical protein
MAFVPNFLLIKPNLLQGHPHQQCNLRPSRVMGTMHPPPGAARPDCDRELCELVSSAGSMRVFAAVGAGSIPVVVVSPPDGHRPPAQLPGVPLHVVAR